MDRREDPSADRVEKSSLRSELRREIEDGIDLAADPDNAHLPDLVPRTTTYRSPWYGRTCRQCRLKFREGDQVRLCPECETPYHEDPQYALSCWTAHFAEGRICTVGGRDRFSGQEVRPCRFQWHDRPTAEPTDSATGARVTIATGTTLSSFIGGLETFWRPFGGELVQRVEPGSDLVGRNCPWCRFRIRLGDAVVACPCGCGTCFHQDVFRHLTCWNEWNGGEGNDYCPITGRPYDQETPADEEAGGRNARG